MDSTAVDAASGARSYYLFRDAHGTAHMVDLASEVPAGAKQVQKVTVPGKEAPPVSTLSRLQSGTLERVTGWLPASVRANLQRTHMTWNAAGGALILLFFFIRSPAFRSLTLKVVLPLVLLVAGIGGFMTYRHRQDGGAALAQGLSEARRDANTMRQGLRQQDRVMQQVEAGPK